MTNYKIQIAKINNKRHSGQIVIVSLFTLAIFMVIGASVATQLVFEQKKGKLEEQTKEAYYAAESGVEKALKQILIEGSDLDIPGYSLGGSEVSVDIETSIGAQTFKVPGLLNSGQYFILNLEGYSPSPNQVRVCWDKETASTLATLFYEEAGIEKTYTYAINAATANIQGTVGLLTASSTSTDYCSMGTDIKYTINLNLPAGVTYHYLALWNLYDSGVQYGFQGAGANLPALGSTITSSADVESGDSTVTRRVRYFISSIGYPPGYLLNAVYAVGGVSYGPGVNW